MSIRPPTDVLKILRSQGKSGKRVILTNQQGKDNREILLFVPVFWIGKAFATLDAVSAAMFSLLLLPLRQQHSTNPSSTGEARR